MSVKTQISPLAKMLRLADTPSQEPQYALPVRLASGETIQVADPRATRSMLALMDMNAVLGGAACHWGGPSAFAELMSALHGLMFHDARQAHKPWHELFLFVNDGGHCENGLYALKANYGYAGMKVEELKTFRAMGSRLTGHGESHLFPEGVLLSNGPLGSAFPQAQGLAFADALSGRSRVTVCALTDGAAQEGEAREAFAAVPGFAVQGKMSPFVLIISDNNTGLTGRIDQQSFAMTPTFQSLPALGWDVVELNEAHDLTKVTQTIADVLVRVRQNPKRPVAIHARTIKGYGIQKTVDSNSGGHGFPLKHPAELRGFLAEIYAGSEVPTPFLTWADELVRQVEAKTVAPANADVKVQVGVSKALLRKQREGLPILSFSADLPGSTGMAEFQKALPQNTQDIGVAESNMVSMAIGAAALGYIPVVDTFAQFGVSKGALPLTMAALSQAPVLAIFSHVGFQDAADGASHQALTYFAMASSIPHTQVVALSSADEADALVGQAVDEYARAIRAGQTPDSYVFFLGRENFPSHYAQVSYQLGKAQVLRPSARPALVIAAAGAMVGQALQAAQELAAQGIEAVVINPSLINRPDVATFKSQLALCGGRLVTVEDHQLIGGMGAILTHALVQAGVNLRARSLGVNGEFGQSAYNAIDLYRKHGMDAAAIAQAARELIAGA